MRKLWFLLSVFVTAGGFAQSKVSVEGKIVDENGVAVEYAAVGIPSRGTGTLSGADGVFVLDVEALESDTVLLSHVSFMELKMPLSDFAMTAGNVVMKSNELDEVTVYSGKKKKSKLVGKGMKVPGGATMWTVGNKGCEIGSMVEADKVFELHEISFNVRSNSIPGAKFSVNLYKEGETAGEFVNTLCKPVYFNVPVDEKSQKIKVEITDNVVVEPGRDFVSILFVDYDNSAETSADSNRIYFPLYLKGSYKRNGVMGEFEEVPVNMGLSLKGFEYR